jgi:hypothetical protein
MPPFKYQLSLEMKDPVRRARIIITADNRVPLDGVHEFLNFQIQDHHGGLAMVRQPGHRYNLKRKKVLPGAVFTHSRER